MKFNNQFTPTRMNQSFRASKRLSTPPRVLHSAIMVSASNTSVVTGSMKNDSDNNDLLKNSSLYREFQAEREEIMKHKWIESEKAGHDIGFEMALTDWIVRHRARWRRTRQK
jgi:hypothetical protein